MATETNVSAPDIAQTLGAHRKPTPWRRFAKWIVFATLAALALYFFFGRDREPTILYITQEARIGDIVVTVTATGNLEPRNQVDIGSELSGTVRSVDVSVNAEVKAGEVLAELDTTRLQAQVLQAQSSLETAQARVVQANASEAEARANYERLVKVRELSGNKIPSQQDMDVAQAAVTRARGDVEAAKATVAQARASLDAVRTDLSKTKITSPINGVVLARSVEPGSTVAASLQAPVLFTLAEDLQKMELHVAVDEADIGAVKVGQEATFTVDAFPNRTFSARITQVHFASNNTQKSSSSTTQSSATSTGVVTYETVLEVDNPELLLRPGMTATAQIITTNITDALLVPNAALRFQPEGPEFESITGANSNRAAGGSPLSALVPAPRMRMGPGGRGQQQGQGAVRSTARVWILENDKPELVIFRPGASDGRFTQVLELGATQNQGRTGSQEANEELRKARERRIEPGTLVIVDAESKTKS